MKRNKKIIETKSKALEILNSGEAGFSARLAEAIGCSESLLTLIRQGKRGMTFEKAHLIVKYSPKVLLELKR